MKISRDERIDNTLKAELVFTEYLQGTEDPETRELLLVRLMKYADALQDPELSLFVNSLAQESDQDKRETYRLIILDILREHKNALQDCA